MSSERAQPTRLHRFSSVGHNNGNDSLNFKEDEEELYFEEERREDHQDEFTKNYSSPYYKTRSFSQSRIDQPICTSTPIPSSNRRPSLNSTFRRFLRPKMGTNTCSQKICRLLDSPECSRAVLQSKNADVVSPILIHKNNFAKSLPKLELTQSPAPIRKNSDIDIISRLNSNGKIGKESNSKGDDLMIHDSIANQPDTNLAFDESPCLSPSGKDFSHNQFCSPIGSPRTSYANKSNYADQNGESVLFPPSTPTTTVHRFASTRGNFNLAKSRTMDSVSTTTSDRRFSGSNVIIPNRPSDFPKTNFHLFGYRGRKSVNELVSSSLTVNSLGSKTLAIHKSCMNMSSSTQQSTSDCDDFDNRPQGENTRGESIINVEGVGNTATISQPGTPDLRKSRLPGNFMRRSATIAFSKGRKLSGLLGYSLPRR